MSLHGIQSSFTFDGQSFDSEAKWIAFMDQNYPQGSDLLRSWFAKKEIRVKTSGSTGKPKSIAFKGEQMAESAVATGYTFMNATAMEDVSVALLWLVEQVVWLKDVLWLKPRAVMWLFM